MLPIFNGLLTGLLLQFAIGPVFFYILGITIDSNYFNSLCAIFAVTLVDYLYIILSLLGIGKFLDKSSNKKIFGIVSSIVLIIFGLLSIYKGATFINQNEIAVNLKWTPVRSFISCFILTISSPLTIIFWASIFSAKAVEKNYNRQQLIPFGIGAGFATFLFLSIVMFIMSLVKASIPNIVIQILNICVGVVLIYCAVKRIFKTVKT